MSPVQEDVDDAPTFKEAAKLLMKWLEAGTCLTVMLGLLPA